MYKRQRINREYLSLHDITQDDTYEHLRTTAQLGPLLARYTDALENAAAGTEESLVFVRKASRTEMGYGLFASRSLPSGTILGEYGGRYKRISDSDADEYAWRLPEMFINGTKEQWTVDAGDWGNALRFANDLGPGTWNIAVKFIPWNGHWHVVYETSTPVLEGEELSVAYGTQYWARRRNFKQ